MHDLHYFAMIYIYFINIYICTYYTYVATYINKINELTWRVSYILWFLSILLATLKVNNRSIRNKKTQTTPTQKQQHGSSNRWYEERRAFIKRDIFCRLYLQCAYVMYYTTMFNTTLLITYTPLQIQYNNRCYRGGRTHSEDLRYVTLRNIHHVSFFIFF